MASDAVTLNRVSRIVGYKLTTGDFRATSPNLPQKIAVFAEANTDNQETLDVTPKEITSAQEAGSLYGYGSPIYLIARILLPKSGGGVNGVPVVVYPQVTPEGATEKILTITPTGVANDNGTHYVVISGRDGLDGQFYAVNIESGDTTDIINAKMADAINNILGSPVVASDTDYEITLTTKWKGLTADELSVTIDTGDNDLGITYAIDEVQSGSGTPSVSSSLDTIGNEWVTLIVNGYGTHAATMTAFESWNGKPGTNPTGRFQAVIMKPAVVFTGTLEEDPSSISDARLNECTIALCSAPLSPGLSFEAAANYCVREAVNAQNTPHLDISGQELPDMPVPSDKNIGDMADYDKRDQFVKKGCTTVDIVAGVYVVQDFVTTYHKLGEDPPQFRYVRNLILDFNVRYAYYLLEQINVVDHVIANDNDTVSAEKVIKPKQWKQQLNKLADDLVNRALIVDAPFMQNSIVVNLGTSNPDRLETSFKYKRSGTVRVASTTAQAGFNFGTLN
jgi:phage tail sheath gpL-like